jgi:hypothetical protein
MRVVVGALLICGSAVALAADSFSWNAKQDRVSADIISGDLHKTLERVAGATGWQIFLEPETRHVVSAKFTNLPAAEALRLLLGEVSFALLPGANTSTKPRLFVFRTSQEKATQLIRPAKPEPKVIPNELVVRLKPGVKIDDVARSLGAKVIGRLDGLNAYRLQFDDDTAAHTAKEQLATSSEVASVENNYSIDRPETPEFVPSGGAPSLSLQLKPPPDNGRVVIGLIDTAVQPLSDNLNQFLQKPISVAGAAQNDPNSPTHGTAMAETILRSLQAITKGSTSVQILPVDVYGPNQNTSSFDVASGVVQAVNGGARVINLSLGSDGDSSVLRDVIRNAASQNILFIGAAGNQPVTTPFYPAAYPWVDAVTALDNGQIASYANRGSFVGFAAPGTSVIPYGSLAYDVQGTSVSAALISGLAAGYMDSNHTGTQAAQTFLQSNFALPGTGNQPQHSSR